MAGPQWPLPEPHKGWLLKSDLRKKAILKSGLIKRWLSGPKLDKKPESSKKWLPWTRPLEPLPLGVKCKPWFKDNDRQPSCCFSRQNNKLGKCPTSMENQPWVFVKEGVDDFRRGCPSPEDVITRGPREGFLPMIAHRIPRPPPKKIHREPPTGADLCSKLSAAQPARKAFVENTKASLSKHPLATYLKLEKDLSPDLLLKVLEVLDPDRQLEDTWAYCEGTKERKKTPTHLCEEHPEEGNLEPPQAVNLETPEAVNLEPPQAVNLETPWKFNLAPAEAVYLEPPEAVILEPPEAVNQKTPQAVNVEPSWKFNLEPAETVNLEPPQEVNLEPAGKVPVESAKESLQSYLSSLLPEDESKPSGTMVIPKVPVYQKPRRTTVPKFCRRVDENFGSIDIEEKYIMKKFEIDFEGPLTDNAVKIKEISQLPLNIRPSKQMDEIKQRKFSLQEANWERKVRKPEEPYKPNQEQIRYGTGYVHPKSWKKLVSQEPLPDPKVVRDKECWSYGRHLEPGIIDELYGPTAVKDCIASKGYRMPDVVEKMFLRKDWKNDSVKTPVPRVMKLISKPKEEDSGDEED